MRKIVEIKREKRKNSENKRKEKSHLAKQSGLIVCYITV